MPEKKPLDILYSEYLANTLSEDDLQDFLLRLNDAEALKQVEMMMERTWREMYGVGDRRQEIGDSRISNKEQGISNDEIDGVLSTRGIDVPEHNEVEVKVEHKQKIIHLWRWVAAAVIIGFVVWGLWFVVGQDGDRNDGLRQAQTDIKHDVKAPEVNRAMITLADGRVVAIDSLTSIDLGNVSVAKNADGEVVYSGKGGEMLYNTLYNPRGSKVVSLMLSDGTKVWLNSESSLRYPIAFNGNTRPVEIVGEAYFEVAKDPNKKFIVTSNGLNTEVLGTQFNVNAYEDEGEIRVTLLEGSVVVNREDVNREGANREKVKLVPGQSATLHFDKLSAGSAQSDIKVENDVDLEAVMAWRNNKFVFNGNKLEDVMRQISRWYDVEVRYVGKKSDEEFVGVISRNVNISELLSMMQKTGAAKFEVKGSVVVVR